LGVPFAIALNLLCQDLKVIPGHINQNVTDGIANFFAMEDAALLPEDTLTAGSLICN
jgi:hypothetical protein